MENELNLELNETTVDASAQQADESVVKETNEIAENNLFSESEEYKPSESFLEASRRAKKRKKLTKALFIIAMMAYPVLHFIVMWVYVNFRSLLYTFQVYKRTTGWTWVGFENYGEVFKQFFTNADTQRMLLNSLLYVPVTCLITIPLSIVFSYIIFKKIKGAGAFRTIFFLPSIVPLVILTMVFQFGFQPSPIGIVTEILKVFGAQVPKNLAGASTPFSVYFFCIWAGIGYYIILLGGAMARIPKGVMEYSQLEGVGMVRELIQICIPLSWPTIVTVLVLGMTSMFTVFLQPFFLTGYVTDTKTLALLIFNDASAPAQYGYLATLGLVCSIIGAPLIMLGRFGLNKCFAEVEF